MAFKAAEEASKNVPKGRVAKAAAAIELDLAKE